MRYLRCRGGVGEVSQNAWSRDHGPNVPNLFSFCDGLRYPSDTLPIGGCRGLLSLYTKPNRVILRFPDTFQIFLLVALCKFFFGVARGRRMLKGFYS